MKEFYCNTCARRTLHIRGTVQRMATYNLMLWHCEICHNTKSERV